MPRPAPQRVAPPHLLAAAASAIYAQVAANTAIPDDQRHLWVNAVTRAFNQLIEGVRFEREPDGAFLFPSRSRSGVAHRVNGRCSCEAADEGAPCWHRAARRMVLWLAAGAGESPAPAPAPVPPAPPLAPPGGQPAPDPAPGPLRVSPAGELAGFARAEAEAAPTAPAPRPAPRRLAPVTPIRGLPARGAQAEADELFPERP